MTNLGNQMATLQEQIANLGNHRHRHSSTSNSSRRHSRASHTHSSAREDVESSQHLPSPRHAASSSYNGSASSRSNSRRGEVHRHVRRDILNINMANHEDNQDHRRHANNLWTMSVKNDNTSTTTLVNGVLKLTMTIVTVIALMIILQDKNVNDMKHEHRLHNPHGKPHDHAPSSPSRKRTGP
jgi:hypothetical protein